jgi:hypothetical protein
MARTWESQRLANERAHNARLEREITGLAEPLARLVLRYATETDENGERIIPNTRQNRQDIKRDTWEQVIKPYFIGSGIDPLDGVRPQSPFMTTVVSGITGAITIQAERQISIINRYASDVVKDWLTGARLFGQREMFGGRINVAEQGGAGRPIWYDPFHLFVNPNGYRLSDNGWRSALQMRSAIDNLLDQGIRAGTSAVKLGDQLEPYLWPEAARVRTKTPYGSDGSYWARRLSRTEITAAAGRSYINASLANPFIEGTKWNLSQSHPCCDICDELAAGGENGDGVYPKDAVPQYPAHPHELCYLTPEMARNIAEINARWEAQIDARTPEAVALRGAFSREWLIAALINGWMINTIFEIVDFDVLLGREERAAA